MGFNCECLDHISVGSGDFPINFHEFLWFPMGRGIEKLKTHHFFTNLSSPHLFNIVAMVLELVVDDFRWFSMVRGIGQLKTHHLSTNLSSPDAAATTAAGAATMTATRDLANQDQFSVGFLCISMVFEDVRTSNI